MIIWINGAFGSGKSSVATALHKRIENAYIFDPEETGFYIRANVPQDIYPGDFQDIKLWREINYRMLLHISRTFKGTIIAPMTITDHAFFNEIVGELRLNDVDIKHFTLLAKEQTLLKRLDSRGDDHNSWAAQQVGRCTTSLGHELFDEHIDTESIDVEEVATYIMNKCF